MLIKINCLLLLLYIGVIDCNPPVKPTIEDIKYERLAEFGTLDQINYELLYVPAPPKPDKSHIKRSLGLFVAGLLRGLRVREPPILTALRLRTPDNYLLQFVVENPHILKSLIQTLFTCLQYYTSVDETLYAITQKMVHRVQDNGIHLQNQFLQQCVDAFNYFDKEVQSWSPYKPPIRKQKTRNPRQATMESIRSSVQAKYGQRSDNPKISSSLFHYGFNGMGNVMRNEIKGMPNTSMRNEYGNPNAYPMPEPMYQNGYGAAPQQQQQQQQYPQQYPQQPQPQPQMPYAQPQRLQRPQKQYPQQEYPQQEFPQQEFPQQQYPQQPQPQMAYAQSQGLQRPQKQY